MRNLLKQFKKGSREVRLTVEEKSLMRQALVRFARENPITHTSHARHSRSIVSPYSFMRKARGYKILSATVIGGILIGGTVSFAAEGALPGNVLYPVKTELNERVRSVVAVTPQAKAEWDVKLVERRLSEVKEVGLLDTVPLETKEIARENVKKYTERAQKRIVELDDNDDEEHALIVAENLARVLQSHESMLLEDIQNIKYEDDDADIDNQEEHTVDEPKHEVKKTTPTKKESVIKRVREIVPTRINTSSTLSGTTSTSTMKKDDASSREQAGGQGSDVENRSKKGDTESLEKTVNDIREVREKLEKRNKEKKAEYEKRKEARSEEKEKDKEEEKDKEQKTYISAPSSEHER